MTKLHGKGRHGMLLAACLVFVPTVGFGQSIGMLQDERAVAACSPGYQDYRNGTGVIYGGATPVNAPINFDYSYGAGSPDSADVSQSVHGYFGAMSVSTSGSAQSGGGNGAFTWSSTFWGGDVVIGAYDYITPSQNMDIEVKYTVTGTSSFQANPDGGTYANVVTDFYLGGNQTSNDFALNGTSTYDQIISLNANQPYLMFTGLGWDCDANSNDGGSNFASYQMSAAADVTITSLTPGATYSSLSGHNYATPEPKGAFVIGLGALGLFLKRRRAR